MEFIAPISDESSGNDTTNENTSTAIINSSVTFSEEVCFGCLH